LKELGARDQHIRVPEEGVELINRRLDSLKDVLDIIDVERVVRHIRGDRERR
jgi:hypothetical protein